MFRTIFSRKSSKGWVAAITPFVSYYVASQTGLPPEVTASILTGALTWAVPNGG